MKGSGLKHFRNGKIQLSSSRGFHRYAARHYGAIRRKVPKLHQKEAILRVFPVLRNRKWPEKFRKW